MPQAPLEKNYWVDSERNLRGRSKSIFSHHSPVSHFVSPPTWVSLLVLNLQICDWFPRSAVLLFLTNLVWRICSLCFAFPFLLRCTRHGSLSLCEVIFFCIVLYGPMSPTMTPLFCFWSLFFLLVWFLVCSVVFLVWSFFCFIALWRPIGLCTGPSSALLLRPITTKWSNCNAIQFSGPTRSP